GFVGVDDWEDDHVRRRLGKTTPENWNGEGSMSADNKNRARSKEKVVVEDVAVAQVEGRRRLPQTSRSQVALAGAG
ncbi:hypothetical protein U1Q18_044577, partial [Sarracenia purpurea var. burkii]